MPRLLTIIALSLATPLPCAALTLPAPIIGQVNVPSKGGQPATAPSTQPVNTSSEGNSAASPQGQQAQQQPSVWPTLIMFGAIFGIFWVFIIRPQQKTQKEHASMVAELKVGDDVVTQSGMYGRVTGFDDSNNAVILEIAKDTRVRIVRSQVGGHQKTQESNS